ncbi:hypothetical protein GCM10027074_67340 [Streptomyces deserti]
MRKRKLGSRLAGVVAFLASMMMFATPAHAADWTCWDQSYTDGAQVVPYNTGKYKTRAVTRQQARNTWDDWIWRGPIKICPAAGRECKYSHERTESTTSGWSIGGGFDLGNASSPSKKWYNVVASLVGGYGRSTTVTTNFNWEVTVGPRDKVQPVQVVVRRWTQGDWVGGFVRTGGSCSTGPRGGYGTRYEWNPNVRFGNWAVNVRQWEFGSYAINDRIL